MASQRESDDLEDLCDDCIVNLLFNAVGRELAVLLEPPCPRRTVLTV
jgi:hypothetical protein